MNKFKLIFILTLTVLFTGCNLLPGNTQTDQSENLNQADQQMAQNGQDLDLTGDFLDLVAQGDAVMCTWNSTEVDGMDISGTAYVADQKMRAETTMINREDNSQIMANSIIDGQTIYSWTDNSNQGTMMDLSRIEEMSEEFDQAEDAESNPDVESLQTLQQDYQFNCQPWTVDQSMLTPPTDVEFTDFSQIMENFNTQFDPNSVDSQDLCGLCENIPDQSAKQACLQNCGQ